MHGKPGFLNKIYAARLEAFLVTGFRRWGEQRMWTAGNRTPIETGKRTVLSNRNASSVVSI